jgi:Tat protein translocase TatB subunit
VFGIGMTELMVIFVVALLVLGPKKLPGLARSLGRSLAEFRRASADIRREFLDVADEARIQPPHRTPPAKPAETRPASEPAPAAAETSPAAGATPSSDVPRG